MVKTYLIVWIKKTSITQGKSKYYLVYGILYNNCSVPNLLKCQKVYYINSKSATALPHPFSFLSL